MENTDSYRDSKALLLTKNVFNKLLDTIVAHFKQSHGIETCTDSQLFGFGNYDVEKPNLKNDLELILKGYVNGKYLYNKQREAISGKPIIKISREYKSILFNYLGYKGILEFLNKDIKKNEEKDKQLQLLNDFSANEDFYYVIYYYGEDRKMTKGQLIIHNNWKTFEIVFVYFNNRGEHVFYELFGNIKQENNFVYLDSKMFLDGRKLEGSKMIFYVGMASQNERPILIGAYSSYDKYDHSIAGKLMLVRMDSKQQMEVESKSPKFDPAICQELVKYRFIVPSRLPKKLSHLSSESPYASIFGKLSGDYYSAFLVGEKKHKLAFKIQEYDYNIISNTKVIELEKDRISLESKGQILEMHFEIIGVFLLQKVSIYVKIYELLSQKAGTAGHFSGIDINNHIVSGEVEMKLTNDE